MDRFTNLTAAGLRLAEELQKHSGSNAIVLGIANGGVPVAAAVAQKLALPFDIALLKRLLTPRGPMFPVCAFNIAGTLVVDDEVPGYIQSSSNSPVAQFLDAALNDFAQRTHSCRDGQPSTVLSGREIILVDNGIQTGSTITAMIRALRRLKPSRIVTAVPVAPAEIRAEVEQISDEVVCLSWPEIVGHVGMWYVAFARPSDDQVRESFRRSLVGSNA